MLCEYLFLKNNPPQKKIPKVSDIYLDKLEHGSLITPVFLYHLTFTQENLKFLEYGHYKNYLKVKLGRAAYAINPST